MPKVPDGFVRLVRRAAARYRPAGQHAYWFARGKLRRDPVFAAILRDGLIPSGARVVDVGCGQGVLLALLLEAQSSTGSWPPAWSAPPRGLVMSGFDLRRDAVEAGALALGSFAHIACGDMRSTPLPPCDVVTILDVLHYIDGAAQETLIARCAKALGPSGTLLMRVADAQPGIAFWFTIACDWLVSVARGQRRPRFTCRSASAWQTLLERHGFEASIMPMNEGTPFVNYLLVGRRKSSIVSAAQPGTSDSSCLPAKQAAGLNKALSRTT